MAQNEENTVFLNYKSYRENLQKSRLALITSEKIE